MSMSPKACHIGLAKMLRILAWTAVTCLPVICRADESLVTMAPSDCCDIVADNPPCHNSCNELSLDSPPGTQLRQLTIVAQTCPNTIMSFWHCINSTFSVVSDGAEKWSGKTCCDLALQPQCHNSCKRAKSRSDLSNCRQNEQVTFFHCLDRQEVSSQCCNPSDSSQCRATCKSLFWASTPSATDLDNVKQFCAPAIVSCVENYTHTMFISPEEAVPCCEHAPSDSCKQICRRAMLSDLKDEEKYTMVISECEEAALGDDMWNCLLLLSAKSKQVQYNHGGRIDLIGMDNAKLQCCSRALSNKCQQLCAKTFSNSWDKHYTEFLEDCVNNIKEVALASCITEVDQPCQLGCEGLSYCTAFNQRPMELFQSCSAESDHAAQMAVQMWASGTIILPNFSDQFLPIKDIHQCRPEVWPAIACTLYIKPCKTRAPSNQICREDCLSILNECIDTDRLQPGVSARTFCNILSPADPKEPCMTTNTYLTPSPYRNTFSEITTPCNPNPCSEDELCLLRRRKCKHPGDPDCKQYHCKKACRMGEISSFLVPHRAFVRISKVGDDDAINCYRGCKCGHSNQILNCKNMGCIEPDECLLSSGMIQRHNSQFLLGCNQCACYGGEMICTKRTCLSKRPTETERHQYTGLPCNCPAVFSPVCGGNGQTFSSRCVADCLTYDGPLTTGSCQAQDPCRDRPCGQDERCIPRRDVCLSSKSDYCRQYECVRTTGECNRHSHQPACDSSDQEYSNVCTLLQHGRSFVHWGHCMATCGRRDAVCAMNGVSYPSECAAWAAGVYVDYVGNCRAVGQLLNLNSGEPLCPDVQCPALPSGAHCRPITTPGTCCPKCVAEIRLLYSRLQARDAARVSHSHQVTVRDVLEVVRRHLSVLECDAFGHLSLEDDLVLVIAPVTAHPTILQIQACMAEAEKLGSLIASRSPVIMMHLPTAPALSATIRISRVSAHGAHRSGTPAPRYTPGLLVAMVTVLYWAAR